MVNCTQQALVPVGAADPFTPLFISGIDQPFVDLDILPDVQLRLHPLWGWTFTFGKAEFAPCQASGLRHCGAHFDAIQTTPKPDPAGASDHRRLLVLQHSAFCATCGRLLPSHAVATAGAADAQPWRHRRRRVLLLGGHTVLERVVPLHNEHVVTEEEKCMLYPRCPQEFGWWMMSPSLRRDHIWKEYPASRPWAGGDFECWGDGAVPCKKL